MLKILLGVGLGFLLFTNQDARQITADVLRATGDAIAPADESKGERAGESSHGAVRFARGSSRRYLSIATSAAAPLSPHWCATVSHISSTTAAW